MSTIIVLTDFSNTSRNALRYAAAFSRLWRDARLLMLNVYTVPTSYSGEGIALAAIRDAVLGSERQLEDELEWAKTEMPGIDFAYKAVAGKFIDSLQEQVDEEQAVFIIMGTPAGYGEMSQWDVGSLHALTDLSIPVLTVPVAVQYSLIYTIAFACVPATITSHAPFEKVKQLLAATGARMHVVTVVPPARSEPAVSAGEGLLRSTFPEPATTYHTIAEDQVVAAIGHFVETHHIDLLLVMPGRHRLWYNLFHKSHARELARLNLIPVMALHEEN
jgi:nucleotide-binding universal stress UspA family protein